MQDKSAYNNNCTTQISEDLQEYINNFVKDAALSGRGFDTFSRYVKIYGKNENLDVEALLENISDLLGTIRKYNANEGNTTRKGIEDKATLCFVSKDTIYSVLKQPMGTVQSEESNTSNKPTKHSNQLVWVIGGVILLAIAILLYKTSKPKIEENNSYTSESVTNTSVEEPPADSVLPIAKDSEAPSQHEMTESEMYDLLTLHKWRTSEGSIITIEKTDDGVRTYYASNKKTYWNRLDHYRDSPFEFLQVGVENGEIYDPTGEVPIYLYLMGDTLFMNNERSGDRFFWVPIY